MPDDLNTILNEALPRWAKLTNTKLGSKAYSFTIGSNSEFQDYDLEKYVKALNAARATDMSGTTAILILRGLFEAYVDEKSFKLHALLYAADKVESSLAELRQFHALITRDPCEEAVATFKKDLRAAAKHYSYDLGKLKETLANERALGDLRLAASESLDTLAVHQFTQGARDSKPLQYNRQIFEFTSINAFVYALRQQLVKGITLALIRGSSEEDDLSTYKAHFMLGLRNGETITILTDFQEGAHPQYHNVTRRPDRRLQERAQQHWFPYRLLQQDPIKHQHLRSKTTLVPRDAKAIVIEEITNLEPSEFVWLTLLFDLIAARFDRDDHKTPELSYTGEMVVAPHALVEASSAIARAGQYVPLVLPKLTIASVTPELAANHEPLGHNAWLEERYRDRVPEILLDVVGQRRALEVGARAEKQLFGNQPAGKREAVDRPRGHDCFVGRSGLIQATPLAPQALDPTYFGTAKTIEQTRAWYARANLIQGVRRLAIVDFLAKRELILAWYRARIARNMSFIWKAVAQGELLAPTATWLHEGPNPFPLKDELLWKESNILQQQQAKHWSDASLGRRVGILFGDWNCAARAITCAIAPPAKATIFTLIQPNNPQALARLMGIPGKKLPWPLQHWSPRKPYTGNSILERVDPQDSRLNDPWSELDLCLSIALSKRAFNGLRKEHGLTPLTLISPREA